MYFQSFGIYFHSVRKGDYLWKHPVNYQDTATGMTFYVSKREYIRRNVNADMSSTMSGCPPTTGISVAEDS